MTISENHLVILLNKTALSINIEIIQMALFQLYVEFKYDTSFASASLLRSDCSADINI